MSADAMEKVEEELTYMEFIKQFVQDSIAARISAAPDETCSKCSSPPEMYCVDCNKSFCKPCTIRSHHPGTNDDCHSLEEIAEEGDQGVKIITPMLEEFLVLSVIVFVAHHALLEKDYLYNGNICILTNYIRKGVAMVDNKAWYLLKSPLAMYCNIEDSYWRLFLDFWVRGVVTDSDSIFLLAASFLSAWLFKGAVVIVLVPILSAFYGIAFAILSKLEASLPTSHGPLKVLESIVKKMNVVDFMVSGDDEIPPVTKRRVRPAINYVDKLWYEQNRMFRGFTHFFCATSSVLEQMFTLPMKFVLLARVICMVLSLGPILRMFFGLFFPQLMARHSEWYQQSSSDEYTDRFFRFSLGAVWTAVPRFLGLAEGFGDAAVPLIGLASQLALVPLGVIGLFYLHYHYETYRFTAQWSKGGLRERVRGPCQMGNGCKCDCVQHICS